MSEILVTIPQRFKREDVLRQLRGCDGNAVRWHYCVNRLPREQPTRMHFVHDGEIIGSLPVTDMDKFDQRTLRRPDGSPLKQARRFAIRAGGEFRPQNPPRKQKGFQGWRFFTCSCSECGGLEIVIDSHGREQSCPSCRPQSPGTARLLFMEGEFSNAETGREMIETFANAIGGGQ